MKKREAEQLAPEKVDFILNRIMQILEDNDRLFSANMNFSSAKIEKQCMCTLDIYVPSKDIEEHYNWISKRWKVCNNVCTSNGRNRRIL